MKVLLLNGGNFLEWKEALLAELGDGYYVAYKPISLLCIMFMFIEMK